MNVPLPPAATEVATVRGGRREHHREQSRVSPLTLGAVRLDLWRLASKV
jgi:hypothetical protein